METIKVPTIRLTAMIVAGPMQTAPESLSAAQNPVARKTADKIAVQHDRIRTNA